VLARDVPDDLFLGRIAGEEEGKGISHKRLAGAQYGAIV
jgi:hypothetical protein